MNELVEALYILGVRVPVYLITGVAAKPDASGLAAFLIVFLLGVLVGVWVRGLYAKR